MPMRVEPISDVARLQHAYDNVLASSFPTTELVTREEFISDAASGTYDVLGAFVDNELCGVIVGEPLGAAVLVAWLAVTGGARGTGVGGALLTTGAQRWRGLDGVRLVLAEIERPDLFDAHPDFGDPARRLKFYERHGLAVLNMPYYQPPIGEGKPRVFGLMLTVVESSERVANPRLLTSEETNALRDALLVLMGTPSPGDDETRRVFEAIEHPAGVLLLPLSDYAGTPTFG